MAKFSKKKIIFNKGMATLEILMAMAIIVIALSATLLVSSGNQNILVDSQTNREALSKAEELIEKNQALSRKDFKLVVPISSTTDDIYEKALYVTNQNSFIKKILAVVSWKTTGNRDQTTSLSAIVTDFENGVGGDTCYSNLTGNWANPIIKNSVTDLGQLISDTSGSYSISSVDAYLGKLYVTVSTAPTNTKETFFVFDIKNPNNPTLLGKLDNSPTVTAGLSKTVISTSTTENFAYVSNPYGSAWATCTPGPNCAQLQVIDITNPASPTVTVNFEIATKTSPFIKGSSGQSVGNTIFYKDGLVYLGLTKTLSGPEFNIIDVHNPTAPFWVGGYSVGNTINSIFVRGKYAYLVTPNSQELIILDVSDPSAPVAAGGFDAPDSVGNGKSVYSYGDMLYLGRTVTASNPEFYVLNNTNPGTTLPQLGSFENGSSINGLIVRDTLAFLITNTQLQIIDTSIPATISSYTSPLTLPSSGGTPAPSFDCEGNYFFVGTNSSSNKGALYSITAS